MIGSQAPRVLVADPLSQTGLDLLQPHLQVVLAAEPADLQQHIASAEALIVRSRTRVTAQLLDRGERLQLVARAGIGVDNIDVPAATQRGILVINAPLGNVRSTAEHTIALIFGLARRLVAAHQAVRSGIWKSGYQGMQLAGKRLGVVGIGKVGGQVAIMAAAIGLEVVAYDPYLPDDAWQTSGVRSVSFDELLGGADIVTLHVPISAETRNLIGASQLARMKPGSLLINCARGGLVDEMALAAALRSGQLAGAAVDVFVNEPPLDSPLLAAPNVILTPHVAASTLEAQEQVSAEIAAQVVDYFAGRPVAYPINPIVLGRA